MFYWYAGLHVTLGCRSSEVSRNMCELVLDIEEGRMDRPF